MSTLYCGFAQTQITPDPKTGVYIDGYSRRMTPAEGVRDPLYVKVCAIRSGDEVFAIAAFDICGFNERLKAHLRSAIRRFAGLQDHQFVICATHTHAGPACGVLTHFPINWIYWNEVGLRAAQTVLAALKDLTEGCFRFGFGPQLTLPFNRRGKDVIDRRVHVCGFFDRSGTLKGVISSASCHPVCITDMLLSGDYPGIMTARAEREYPGVPFLFLQGRGADIDPNFPDRDRVAMQPRLGGEFSDSVFSALEHPQERIDRGALRSLFETIRIPMTYPDKTRTEQELRLRMERVRKADTPLKETEALVEFYWYERCLRDMDAGIAPGISADLQVVSVGDTSAFVFVPFELLTNTGNTLEQMLTELGYQPGQCFVVGYSNGTNGYLIPSDECQEEDYETVTAACWYDLPGIYCPESEQAVLTSLGQMLRRIRPGEAVSQ